MEKSFLSKETTKYSAEITIQCRDHRASRLRTGLFKGNIRICMGIYREFDKIAKMYINSH